jgi:hypothetical protein
LTSRHRYRYRYRYRHHSSSSRHISQYRLSLLGH